jgi:hypothetical protein
MALEIPQHGRMSPRLQANLLLNRPRETRTPLEPRIALNHILDRVFVDEVCVATGVVWSC